MRNVFLAMTRNRFGVICYVKALFLILLMSVCFASSLHAGQVGQPSPVDNMNFPVGQPSPAGNMDFPDSQGIRNGVMASGNTCPTREEIVQKTRTLQMPFIANTGQMDERVRFYAKTFGGTVFVTKEGEIVYSLPSGRDVPAGASQESGRGLKHGCSGTEGQGGNAGEPYRILTKAILDAYLPGLQGNTGKNVGTRRPCPPPVCISLRFARKRGYHCRDGPAGRLFAHTT